MDNTEFSRMLKVATIGDLKRIALMLTEKTSTPINYKDKAQDKNNLRTAMNELQMRLRMSKECRIFV
jgi:hypothetical protein